MKTVMLALVDKAYPPEHSFIDGMLCSTELKKSGVEVRLLTSKSDAIHKSVLRYKNTITLPILRPRRGFSRFANIWTAYRLIADLSKRYKSKNKRIVIFVRNEPIYLLSAAIARRNVDGLVYQQSFPHEKSGYNIFKKSIAKLIFRITKNRVNSILAISPLGLERMRTYFGNDKAGDFIPLLNGSTDFDDCLFGNDSKVQYPIKFVYTGTHAKNRKLEIILEAIKNLNIDPEKATFTFIGGKHEEVEYLRSKADTKSLEQKGILQFQAPISRDELLKSLRLYDVGMCLIPPDPIYKEASPTKLAEYMGAGLAVLATKGIDLQEKYVLESDAGLTVNWNRSEIEKAIADFLNLEKSLERFKLNARVYAQDNLTYKKHIRIMNKLVSPDI